MPINPDPLWRLPTREELEAIAASAGLASTIAWLRMMSDGAGILKSTLEGCFCGALAVSTGFLLHGFQAPLGYTFFACGAVGFMGSKFLRSISVALIHRRLGLGRLPPLPPLDDDTHDRPAH